MENLYEHLFLAHFIGDFTNTLIHLFSSSVIFLVRVSRIKYVAVKNTTAESKGKSNPL